VSADAATRASSSTRFRADAAASRASSAAQRRSYSLGCAARTGARTRHHPARPERKRPASTRPLNSTGSNPRMICSTSDGCLDCRWMPGTCRRSAASFARQNGAHSEVNLPSVRRNQRRTRPHSGDRRLPAPARPRRRPRPDSDPPRRRSFCGHRLDRAAGTQAVLRRCVLGYQRVSVQPDADESAAPLDDARQAGGFDCDLRRSHSVIRRL
jgi:hypothetical protein